MPREYDRDDDRDRDDDDRPRRRRDDRDRDEDDRPRRRRDEDDEYDDRPRRRGRDRDEDDDYDDRPRRRRGSGDRPQQAGNGTATASLVLGFLSFCTGPLTGIPAVICGLIGMGKPVGKGMAIAGLLLGTVGTLGGIAGAYFGYMRMESARDRVRDSNNLKIIGLAMHNQHDTNGRFYGPYAHDNFGKVNTGLSWRVGLLPYIEQDNLYKQFRMDEAWDSQRNRTLSNTPIKTYTSPYDQLERGSVNTPYRVFYGGGALFEEDGRPQSFWNIPDGTSNTIMVVHAVEQVQWAEPRDLKYDPKGPLPKLGHSELKGVFQVLMADGSVRSIRQDISERTLRRAITKADGEPLGADW